MKKPTKTTKKVLQRTAYALMHGQTIHNNIGRLEIYISKDWIPLRKKHLKTKKVVITYSLDK